MLKVRVACRFRVEEDKRNSSGREKTFRFRLGVGHLLKATCRSHLHTLTSFKIRLDYLNLKISDQSISTG